MRKRKERRARIMQGCLTMGDRIGSVAGLGAVVVSDVRD